jgi:hypothetical protein
MTTIRVVRIADAPPQPQLLKPQRLVASSSFYSFSRSSFLCVPAPFFCLFHVWPV